MKRPGWRRILSLLIVALTVLAVAGPGSAQSKPDLTVALSSFSTEVLDPVLAGHFVKYYLSLMFDYLVGSTPDGPALDHGRSRHQVGELRRPQALDLPPAQGRDVPQRRSPSPPRT